ncbi:hypothetical protein [Psittacicella gerlachiana]|uniref:Uncharacterized protein n=1 Tax=Psittacicella gerlachiana TaxID=2028574 RepID=A0A3A1Y520_9GAMM|nr:hypothetical protein [Psittacicella gerlachiana]RIY32675.1 hypothetical protein CKF59_06805 [Psittacicella gerlachiana]
MKFFFLSVVAILTLTSSASSQDLSRLSVKQLENNYHQLLQENPDFVPKVKTFLLDFSEFAGQQSMSSTRFVQLVSSTFLAELNQDFTLTNNYYQAKKIEQFAQLGDTCMALFQKNAPLLKHDDSCSFISAIYLIANHDRDTLQTMALFGKMQEFAGKQTKEALSKSEQELLAFSADPQKLKLDFNLRLPTNNYLLQAQTKELIYKLYQVHLVAE